MTRPQLRRVEGVTTGCRDLAAELVKLLRYGGCVTEAAGDE
ncbi:MAG: hypothetical protein ACM3ZU_02435 [Bacteroidota bacterium]